MTRPVFDSRDPAYKAPFGAVPSGTRVAFTLRPPRAEGFSRAVLYARFEQRGDETRRVSMPWRGTELGYDEFTCALDVGDYVGLVWYRFVLERLDGGRSKLGEYQLTVYDDGESVPDWFGQGVSYQIFPDRFRRTGTPDPAGLVGDRVVHPVWDGVPDWQPDENGRVRNRDYFGGTLAGITEKLDYLKSLGVDTLYLCPIFEAAENHRYGTADYKKIDPMLGSEEDFSRLCDGLHARGMRLILDGVFNHTGAVSRYFNADGFYPDLGAAQSEDSPYAGWYHFTRWPDEYDSWWGVRTLPAVNEGDPTYRAFIFGDGDSVVRRWLRAGADGWRLDVVDELPDDFVGGLRSAVREEKPDATVLGEVWEDGSNKIAYGVRRRHIWGGHCDGLMNYPFRKAALDYLQGGDASEFIAAMEALRENYPPFAFYNAMNALGTHDTPRVLTLLGMGGAREDAGRLWRSAARLDAAQRRRGAELLRVGTALTFCFPGSPTVYYGDEAGMEGFEDPFNRRPYPWGGEDLSLIAWFSALGGLRRTHPALRRGDLRYVAGEGGLLAFTRSAEGETILCACNAGEGEARLSCSGTLLLGEGAVQNGVLRLPARSAAIIQL